MTAREWWLRREPGRGYLAIAIGLLGVVAIVAEVGNSRLANAATIVLFLGAGYALLRFRHALIPLGRRTRRAALAVAVVTAAFSALELSGQPASGSDPLYLLGALLFVGVWCTFVGEPVVRFWIASRRLPAVQRARMRALSAGYAGVIVILLASFVGAAIQLSPIGDAAITVLPLGILPLLAASFAPPVWLRRIWRADEEEAFTRATQNIMLRTPDATVLAQNGLEWAVRLIGGDQGFLADPHGLILATRRMAEATASALLAELRGEPTTEIVRTGAHGESMLRVPMPLGGGWGSLVVLGGPFTPVFGTDEMTRLGQYGATLGIALDREQLASAVRQNAAELEQLNQTLESRVVKRTHELREASSRTEAILESVADGIMTIAPDGALRSSNPAADAIFGLSPEHLATVVMTDLVSDSSRASMVRELEAALEAPTDYGTTAWRQTVGQRRDGSTFPLEFRFSRIQAEGQPLLVCCVRDISERQQYVEQLEYQALHDALTGLPNRALLADRIDQAIASSDRSAETVSVVLIDLDQFKDVNDTLGHGTGDLLLQDVARRLGSAVRKSDTIARLGGDEFALLVSTSAPETDTRLVQKVLGSLREPFIIDDRRIQVSASAGIARHGADDLDASGLLRNADVAMYVAKRERRGVVVYAADEDETNPLRLALRGDLRQAIDQDELELHFQPIVSMQGGALQALEALVRWRHPTLGLLGPDRFIPAAEDSDLIHELTGWVLGRALDALRVLDGRGPSPAVAVNVSARSLTHPMLSKLVAQHLRRTGVDPARLRLEVTETAATTALHGSPLKRLQRMGLSLSIDDFGTGHSSLTRLRELPVAELKIDRSFVLDMAGPEPTTAIVRSTIELAHGLNLKVVAEGVETRELWEALEQLRCDSAQGYLVARPMPLDQLETWVDHMVRDPTPAWLDPPQAAPEPVAPGPSAPTAIASSS